MPKGCIPNKSKAHRLVCYSLYKALLTTCRGFAPSDASGGNKLSSNLQSLVRFRFRHDQRLQNLTRIRDSIEYGRKSLSLLQAACHGSQQAQQQMVQILKEALDMASARLAYTEHCDRDKGNYPAHVLRKKEYARMVQDPLTHTTPKPGAIPILSRPVPLSEIKSKKRRCPEFVVAQGVPFLRYHRRQPYVLSALIRRKLKEGRKHWSTIEALEPLIQLGQDEDAWDKQLRQSHGVSSLSTAGLNHVDEDQSWTTNALAAKREAMAKLRRIDDERLARGEKLYNIMLQEREMAMVEKQAEKITRQARKLENQKEEA